MLVLLTPVLVLLVLGGSIEIAPASAAVYQGLEQSPQQIYRQSQGSVVRVETDRSSGTGFLVRDAQTLATCFHVIEGAKTIKVVTSSGAPLSVTNVQVNKAEDIAILTIGTGSNLQPLRLAADPFPEPGTPVHVIGSPLGFLDKSLSSGSVSAVRHEGGTSLIQFSAAISPGSSGSPVISSSGQVIGMAMGTLESGQLLNFAVPASSIRAALSIPSISLGEMNAKFRPSKEVTPVPTVDVTATFLRDMDRLMRGYLAESAAYRRWANAGFRSESAARALRSSSDSRLRALSETVNAAESYRRSGPENWAHGYFERLKALEEIARDTVSLQSELIAGFDAPPQTTNFEPLVRPWIESINREILAIYEWYQSVAKLDEFRWSKFLEEINPAVLYWGSAAGKYLDGAAPDPAFPKQARVLFASGQKSLFVAGDIITALKFEGNPTFTTVATWANVRHSLGENQGREGSPCVVRVRRDDVDIELTIKLIGSSPMVRAAPLPSP